MKKLILIAVIACLGLTPNYAQNSDDRDTESKLMAIERVVRLQALPSKDLNTLNTFLADEFVLVTTDGTTRSKQEFVGISAERGLAALQHAGDDCSRARKYRHSHWIVPDVGHATRQTF